MATPLRALADMLYLDKSVSWQNDGLGYVLESLRIEPGDLSGVSIAALADISDSIRIRRVVAYLEHLAKEASLAE